MESPGSPLDFGRMNTKEIDDLTQSILTVDNNEEKDQSEMTLRSQQSQRTVGTESESTGSTGSIGMELNRRNFVIPTRVDLDRLDTKGVDEMAEYILGETVNEDQTQMQTEGKVDSVNGINSENTVNTESTSPTMSQEEE